MKKLISVLLTAVLALALAAPIATVTAAEAEATPIIYIRGNGEPLYNANGEKIAADIGDADLGGNGEDSTDKIVEACVNILKPFIFEGLIMDEWDNYGKAIYDELSPMFAEAILDGNGNPQYGTGVNPQTLANSENNAKKDRISGGKYGFYSYAFCFDWRLDPYDHVDRLHTYILTVLDSTNKSQVSLVSRCLGGSLLTAYLERYGHLGLVKNAMYCETLSDGCSLISKGFSGQVDFDALSMQKYEGQLTFCAEIGLGTGISIPELADEIIINSLDLFTQTGTMDSLYGGLESLYNKLYKALIPALFHAFGIGSQPIYWTFVEEQDFDAALELMFGEKDSDARTHFAGLIEKIKYYREHVTSKGNELYKTFSEDYGIHIGVLAKYGYLNAPFLKDYDELSDTLVSFEDASLGATCAKVGKTLSDEYIKSRIEKGYGDYISPDKQVDTSTCFFPETTWVVKNVHHDDFEEVGRALAEKFLNGTNVTVETSGYARFRIKDYTTNVISDMSEDNCADLEFMMRGTEKPTLSTKLTALFKWLKTVFSLIEKLFNGEISL